MVRFNSFAGALSGVLIASFSVLAPVARAEPLPLQHEQFMVELHYGRNGYLAESPIEMDYEGFNNGQAVLMSKPVAIDESLFEASFEGKRSVRIHVKSTQEDGVLLTLEGEFLKRAGSKMKETCSYGMHVGSPVEIENATFVCGNPKASGFELRITNLSSMDRALASASNGFRTLDRTPNEFATRTDQEIKELPEASPVQACEASNCRSLPRSAAVVESSR